MGGKLIETRTATEGPLNSNRWGDASVGEKIHIIEMPRWRFDILHPIDLVEEIARLYGYEKITSSEMLINNGKESKTMTFKELDKK